MKAVLAQIECIGKTQTQLCTGGTKKHIEVGNKDYQWYGAFPCKETKWTRTSAWKGDN